MNGVPVSAADDAPARFELRTHAQAHRVADRAAAVCGANSWGVAAALLELLCNAIEHGNLEIGAQCKAMCLREGLWEAELRQRQADPLRGGRQVILLRTRCDTGWCFEISDQGGGFDWHVAAAEAAHAAITDPARPCGRGIALATRLSGGTLEYLGNGSRVRLLVPFA